MILRVFAPISTYHLTNYKNMLQNISIYNITCTKLYYYLEPKEIFSYNSNNKDTIF